ncbi:MAG TPA: hypothetical protein VFN11_00770, partial [Ktedonobacterales bacterium]|nr:hypothetical protein [Ktedonobacterales bacterium]
EVAETIQNQGLPAAFGKIQHALTDHGIKIGSAEYIHMMRNIAGGSKQMQGMLDLGGHHLKTFADLAGKIGTASKTAGTEITGWALVQKTANQQFDRAKESIGAVFITIGEKLLPVVTTIAKWFADHLPGAIKTFRESVGPVVQKIGDLIHMITSNRPLMNMLKDSFERLKPAIGPILTALAVLTAISFAPLAILIAILIGLFVIITHIPDAIHNASAALGNLLGKIGEFFGHLFGAIGEFVGKWVGKWVDLQERTINTVKQFVGDILGRIGKFKDDTIQHAKDLATGFINALLGLPGKLLTLGENLIKSLAQGINNARGAVLSAVKNIPLLGGIAGGVNSMIPQFASGGTMQSNGMALVGEDGPELVRMPGGAQITPLSRLPQGVSSGVSGSGQPLIIQLNLDGRRAAEVILPHITPALRNALGTHRY